MRRAARLDVYVSSHCTNCGEARLLADEAAASYPRLVVRVIDLDLSTGMAPEYVVAAPTYVLNGRVISLGNPYREELFAYLLEAFA
jgi:Thioredoxin domain